ncbi:MAG: hypothetical protein V3V99_11180 [candidate division Zixibacteria bacterium]
MAKNVHRSQENSGQVRPSYRIFGGRTNRKGYNNYDDLIVAKGGGPVYRFIRGPFPFDEIETSISSSSTKIGKGSRKDDE